MQTICIISDPQWRLVLGCEKLEYRELHETGGVAMAYDKCILELIYLFYCF